MRGAPAEAAGALGDPGLSVSAPPETRSPGVLSTRPPELSPADARRVARDLLGRDADVEPLESERDQNFRVRAGGAGDLVLKISNPAEDPAVVDFQTRALRHVEACAPRLPVPRVVADVRGGAEAPIRGPDGRSHLARLVTFVPGVPFGSAPRRPALLRELGAILAELGRALRGFFHPAADHELLWDLKRADRARKLLVHVPDAERRALADGVLARFEIRARPRLPGLRAQVIHNDVSRWNALVDAGGTRISGIVDFGDMVHAPLVDDVAVTASEVMLGAAEPLPAAAALLAGYEEVEPLRPEERELLYDLVAARLAVGVAISAWRADARPENREYICSDDPMLWSLLERLVDGERAAREALREPGAAAPVAGAADADALLVRRRRLLGPALSHFYRRPLHLVRGRGTRLIDASGRSYLDAYNNVPHVGHCHPEVVAAIARQAALLNTNTRYLHASVLDYAERLVATLPEPLRVCIFVCSGSEANDLAWRLARAHSGGGGALVVEGAYHGTTDAIAALSPGELPAGASPPPHVRALPAPDDYRGRYRRGEPRLGERYAEHAGEALASLRAAGLAPAACFVDPLLSSSGILDPLPGWLAGVFAAVRAAGGVCVADEVQGGFGRRGDGMWSFQAHGVVPDVVTLGKPIGNGHPLAAVVTSPAIAGALGEGREFFSTFGGNPVSCAAGLAVLDVLEREGLVENARRVGARLRQGLESLAERHAWVGDVRGAGLFLGVDLVRDRQSREPAGREAREVMERMREEGVLVGTDGPHANVLKIRPPLCFSEADAALLVEALDRCLARA